MKQCSRMHVQVLKLSDAPSSGLPQAGRVIHIGNTSSIWDFKITGSILSSSGGVSFLVLQTT